MDELVTTELILNWLSEQVKNRNPIDPHTWVDSAQKLNTLVGEDHAKLYDLEQKLAEYQVKLLQNSINESKMTVAESKLHAQANPISKEINILRGKIKRIDESIRIAKLQARLAQSELSNYN